LDIINILSGDVMAIGTQNRLYLPWCKGLGQLDYLSLEALRTVPVVGVRSTLSVWQVVMAAVLHLYRPHERLAWPLWPACDRQLEGASGLCSPSLPLAPASLLVCTATSANVSDRDQVLVDTAPRTGFAADRISVADSPAV
jgi:hypothetical protein